MKTDILDTLSYSDKLIISPDMDGFMSAALLNRYNGSTVVGTYDKNLLCLADGVDPKECLFVDIDMNTSDYVSIGNHMRLLSDGAAERSFNPNHHYEVDKYYEKFPYATTFLISFATEVPTSIDDKIRMAFSDSTLRNMEKYGDNMRNWSKRMEHDAVSYVIWNTDEIQKADDEIRGKYLRQEFASKRFGKERYIQTLNDAFEKEGLIHKPLADGKKYMSDKVGVNTVKRYMSDIISYAEIFTGEYSVTYNEEIEWK
jgi:hypothetical protein